MATKNLARTVIEGGRGRYNKFDRRYSNRQNRRSARAFTHRACLDHEVADTCDILPRRKVYRGHRDRLAAAKRWLASFVGTPWNDVRAQIANRFDTRTIAGQHIVFDHLLPSVKDRPCYGWCHFDFLVDGDGLLQEHPLPQWRLSRRLRKMQPPGKVWHSWAEIHLWAQGRRVGRCGSTWFWFECTRDSWIPCADRYCWRYHRPELGERSHQDPSSYYRQGAALSTKERSFWNELTEDKQKLLSWPPATADR